MMTILGMGCIVTGKETAEGFLVKGNAIEIRQGNSANKSTHKSRGSSHVLGVHVGRNHSMVSSSFL